jgi:hypothetical protein
MKRYILLVLAMCFTSVPALALTIDWSGLFRADNNLIHDYQHDFDRAGYETSAAGGEYVQGAGQRTATYSTMFARLKPKILVNDNVIVHSEWNIGDPELGFFGRSVPRSEVYDPVSTGKGALEISASRLWLDTHTDFGTLQVGRAPMHWGLGVIFNSGDNTWDRFQSTMDTIRLNSKFGYLTLMPLYAKVATGRSLGGSNNPNTSAVMAGSDDITDYGLALKYENPEEELEGGFLYYKRNSGDQQTSILFPGSATVYSTGVNGMNLKLYDLYARKVWKRFELKGELPIFGGEIGDVNRVGSRNSYRGFGFATEATLTYDTWKHLLKFGQASGQPTAETGRRGNNHNALYFNRNYKLGSILFRYNLHGFGVANTDPTYPSTSAPTTNYNSPYDAAIVNARYLMLATERQGEQWTWNAGVVFAKAREFASSGKDFFNYRTRAWQTAVTDQGDNLGFEVDTGLQYRWDESITFGSDLGVFFPGSYYTFSNSTTIGTKADRVAAFSLSVATAF